MTSREIVRRTLEFSNPLRVARSFGDSDFRSSACRTETYAKNWQEKGNGSWERTDDWGNVWERIDPTSQGEVVRGVLDDIAAADAYRFPDFSRAVDYARVCECRALFPDKWLIGDMPGFAFNIARKMRRLDQYLMDLLLQPEPIGRLHDRIDAMLGDMIRNYALAGVDAVMFCEDWGTQDRLLISPALWRREFYPRFERLCALAHELDVNVFMHSCGRIEAIIPGLMEAGIDALQFDQPELHGVDTLAAYQKQGRITFWCPVDIQRTLQQRDEKVIREKALEMLEKLWGGRGGFIAGYYNDNASIGLDPKWQGFACETFSAFGIRGTGSARCG